VLAQCLCSQDKPGLTGLTIPGSMPGSSAAVGMSDGARNVRYPNQITEMYLDTKGGWKQSDTVVEHYAYGTGQDVPHKGH
jgi:hypothetical protein